MNNSPVSAQQGPDSAAAVSTTGAVQGTEPTLHQLELFGGSGRY